MSKKLGLALLGVIIVIIGITIVASHSNSMDGMNMSSNSTSSSTPNLVAADKVTIQNYVFSPMAVKVKVGTTLTWTNHDSVHHTVTMDSGSKGGPHSSDIATGQTYSYTFKTAGTYTYHCEIHPQMHGTVVVTS